MFVLILTLAKDKSWRRAGFILLVPAAILSISSHFLTASAQNVSVSTGHAIAAFFFVVVTGKIVASIFASRELTLDSIFGAICGYLLLGVAWALMYTMLHAASPDSFQISETIRPHFDQGEYSRTVFIYYSFVTLTTVGYGDVTPLSIPARTLSWVEAVAGQLYLAVLVTGLIGALVTRGERLNVESEYR
jgi:voltage-gated potassium channel